MRQCCLIIILLITPAHTYPMVQWNAATVLQMLKVLLWHIFKSELEVDASLKTENAEHDGKPEAPQLSELLWLSRRETSVSAALLPREIVWINRASDGTQLPALGRSARSHPHKITFNIHIWLWSARRASLRQRFLKAEGTGDTETGLFLYLFKHAALNYQRVGLLLPRRWKCTYNLGQKGDTVRKGLASGKRKTEWTRKNKRGTFHTTCAGQHL